jgi:membrane fusion protein (multidrug efflux system)
MLLLLAGCQGKGSGRRGASSADSLSARNKGNGDPIPVEVAAAAKRNVSSYVTATSTLEAERIAQLLAETTGRVTALRREEGDRVSKGQVLIQLEDTQQKLDFQKATIDLDVAEKEWRRAEELEKKGIVSAQDLDEARLRFEAAKHAKARAEYELAKTSITAPFSGVVTERNVNVGETVTPGKPVATVADFDPLVAKFRVPESEIGPVKVGQPVTLEIPSRQNDTQHARVSLVSPVIDQGTGTVKLTAYLKNPRFDIKPGTFVRARVVSATHDSALTIPKRALVSEDGTTHVFTVASDTTKKVAVMPGITDGQFVEILSGLSVGDRVITVGQGGLKPGDKVRIVK